MNPLITALYKELEQDCPDSLSMLESFDWDKEGIHTRYIICITARSGSTWLYHLLSSTKLCGTPNEFFNEQFIPPLSRRLQATSFPDYFERVVRTFQSASTFGFEINFNRMHWLCELVNFKAIFLEPGTRFIALTRRDLLAQAISLLKAIKTGNWHQMEKDGMGARRFGVSPAQNAENQVPNFDDSELWKLILHVLIEEQNWEAFFVDQAVVPLRLVYEDLVTSAHHQVLRILRYIRAEQLNMNTTLQEQITSLKGVTRRLADDYSWQLWSRFMLDYFDELDHVYRLRTALDVNDFRFHLRQTRGLLI